MPTTNMMPVEMFTSGVDKDEEERQEVEEADNNARTTLLIGR